MVRTQFLETIKIFRSDNGKEYFNKVLGEFFLTAGIVHQSSCNYSPQQNDIAERKNKHILEITRTLLLSSKAPNYLWGETILTATYVINDYVVRSFSFIHL